MTQPTPTPDPTGDVIPAGSPFGRRDYACLLLYVTFAIAIGFADLRMRAYPKHAVEKFIPAVLANAEPAPAKYRVLAPYLHEYTVRVTGAAPLSVWYASRVLWILLACVFMHAYLRTWFWAEAAVTGVALMAASIPLTFTNSWAHPDHMPELALFVLGAAAIARRADVLFGVALAAAALNRETAVFLVALYAVVEPLRRGRLVRTMLFGVEWLAIYGGLRLLRGVEHYDYWQAPRNLADLGMPLPGELYDPYYRAYAYFVIVLFGPMLYLALKADDAPRFIRAALLVALCVVVVAFLFSNIIETRIFTPLYALVLPGAIFYLFGSGHATFRS